MTRSSYILRRAVYVFLALVMGVFSVGTGVASAQTADEGETVPFTNADKGQGMSQEQLRLFNNGIYYFNYDRDVCEAAASNGENGGGAFVQIPGDNPKTGYLYFIGRGLTPEISAALIGNFMQESTIEMNPAINQFGGGVGRGIAQWSAGGRWETLKAWAGSRDIFALQTQLDFVYKELVTDNYNGSYTAVQAADSLEAKVIAITDKYEQAGAREIAKRHGYALQILTQYGTGTPPANSGDKPAVGGCAANTNGGVATIVDGFAFPLQVTKTIIENNVGARWCFQAQKNCHHDYNAADIHAPTGTVVLAAKPGTVVFTNTGVASNVVIDGGDGFIYYYTHMGVGTLQVKQGQSVVAGQPIGKVGTSADAQGTNPHLHFDMLPNPPYTTRMACSSAACSGYPFVDVQAILYPIYQKLPQ